MHWHFYGHVYFGSYPKFEHHPILQKQIKGNETQTPTYKNWKINKHIHLMCV